jgi:signal transduction histidine kinase
MDIVQRIGRAAGRMDELLQNLLEYSRVSRAQAKVEPLNINEIVNDVVIQHQGLIDNSGAELHIQPGMPIVAGSRTLFGQAFGNLLTNALKYAQKGTKPVVRITARESDCTVIFCVADEGIGIAPHHQERIFRIFERLHGLAEYPGTGIGLAIVRRAVERMRGRIWVESQEGKGSRFLMELPKPESA